MSSRTRGAKQIFYNVALRLPHLPLHAITDDEVVNYRQFLETILQNGDEQTWLRIYLHRKWRMVSQPGPFQKQSTEPQV